MAAANGRFVALVRQGWNEIPEVMASGVLALFGIGLGTYTIYRHEKTDFANKRYKLYPVYMRPDDPRVAKIHKD